MCGADHLLSQRCGGRTRGPFPQAGSSCLVGPSSLSRLSGLGVGWGRSRWSALLWLVRVVCALRCQVLGFRKPRAFILLLLECLFCEVVDVVGTFFWKEGRTSGYKTRREED